MLFRSQQGEQGVVNGDESTVGALSGAAQKDLMSFNQGYAQNAFNNAFNQYQTQQGNIYQRLGSIAQLGQSAASNSSTGASAFANGIGNSMMNTGLAQASAYTGTANAINNAVGNWATYKGLGGGGSSGAAPYVAPTLSDVQTSGFGIGGGG